MEKLKVFKERNSHYCIIKDINFPQIDDRVSHCSFNQNSNSIFHETWKADSRIYMQEQMVNNDKGNSK